MELKGHNYREGEDEILYHFSAKPHRTSCLKLF